MKEKFNNLLKRGQKFIVSKSKIILKFINLKFLKMISEQIIKKMINAMKGKKKPSVDSNNTKDEVQRPEETYIGYFIGTNSELSNLNFSLLNLRFLNANSDEFNKFIGNNSYHPDREFKLVKDIFHEFRNTENIQALLPIDLKQKVSSNNIYFVLNILKLICPSDINIVRFGTYQIVQNKIRHIVVSYHPFYREDPFSKKNNLEIIDDEIASINEFIPILIDRHHKTKYLVTAWNSYLSSFTQNHDDMKIVSLCISLETIVSGTSELNYRIKRNVGVLVGSDCQSSKRIFDNINKIYGLRSKIVHGSEYKDNKIDEYLPYLRNLVSRMITELISHNISNIEDLNELLTSKGFGDQASLSEDYVHYELIDEVKKHVLTHDLVK